MESEDLTNKAKSEVKSLLASLPIELRMIIGFMLMYFLFMAGVQFVSNRDNFSVQDCWKLQFHNDRAIKMNSCTGEIIELDPQTLKNI